MGGNEFAAIGRVVQNWSRIGRWDALLSVIRPKDDRQLYFRLGWRRESKNTAFSPSRL